MNVSLDTLARVPLARGRATVRSVRSWSIRPADIVIVTVANAGLIVAMWLRHGGLDQLGDLAGAMTAAGQLTALLGTYAALLELVLLSRGPFLDHVVGTDRLVSWHRWVGFATFWLISAHVVFTTLGWAASNSNGILDELGSLLWSEAYVLMAAVGFVMLVAVVASSARAVRQRLSYETWYGLHLYAYLAIVLAFLHQVLVGRDFLDDPVATAYWVALYIIAFGLILIFRLGSPILLNLRHRLVVERVVPEAPGVVSIYLAGRHLEALAASAGQFFQWRFLAGGGWWRPHPYSLSAAPNGRWLRITIQDSGDDSRGAQGLRPGMRVLAEGPYGAFTAARLTRPGALFVAGGIGITPLRAMIEELPVGTDALLLYRASSWRDVVFREELEAIARDKGLSLIYLVGRRGSQEMPSEPLSPEAIRRVVPDIGDRDVFLCGSRGFLTHVRSSMRKLGLRGDQVHAEQFAF